MPSTPDYVITINLNTAIDRVLEVPGLQIGAHAKGRRISRFPAGKAINVSRALARVNCGSIATGFVGKDESSWFEHFLKDTGPGRIICQLLSVLGKTRENITLIDPVGHTDTHIREEGFEITDKDFGRMVSKLGLLAKPNVIMVFSGSLPRGVDIPKLYMLLMMATSGGTKVVLDTAGDLLGKMVGIEPMDSAVAIDGGSSETAGAAEAANTAESVPTPELAMEDNPLWLVKPNAQELAELMGTGELKTDEQIVQAGLKLAKRVRFVVITLGADGAWLIHGNQVWRGRVDVDQAQVVNTVGCGDAMIAGLLESQLSQSQEQTAVAAGEASGVDTVNLKAISGATEPTMAQGPEAFLRRGLAVATANALLPGIAEFTLAQVEQIQQTVHVERYEPDQTNQPAGK